MQDEFRTVRISPEDHRWLKGQRVLVGGELETLMQTFQRLRAELVVLRGVPGGKRAVTTKGSAAPLSQRIRDQANLRLMHSGDPLELIKIAEEVAGLEARAQAAEAEVKRLQPDAEKWRETQNRLAVIATPLGIKRELEKIPEVYVRVAEELVNTKANQIRVESRLVKAQGVAKEIRMYQMYEDEVLTIKEKEMINSIANAIEAALGVAGGEDEK